MRSIITILIKVTVLQYLFLNLYTFSLKSFYKTSHKSKLQYINHKFILFGKKSQDLEFDNRLEVYENEDYDDNDYPDINTIDFKTNLIENNDKEWMFFDVAKINVKGGDGGDGCMAMQREFRLEYGGPCGGNGGDGGSVYLECDKSLNTLAMLRRKVHHRYIIYMI